MALAQVPANVSLWVEFGQTAEGAGRDTTAREAYAEASRLVALGPADRRGAPPRRGAAGLSPEWREPGPSAPGEFLLPGGR